MVLLSEIEMIINTGQVKGKVTNVCFVRIWLVPRREVSCFFIVAVNRVVNRKCCSGVICSMRALLWRI